MKKIFFLVSGIIFSLSALGQQTVILNNIVSIVLPKGVEHLSKEQAVRHVRNKFNNDEMVANSVSRRTAAQIYKVDDILISLFTDDHSVKADHLLKTKNGFDETFAGNDTYASTLKKVNNTSVLVLSYSIGNIGRYNFYCYNSDNSKATTGIIEFDNADKNKASDILNQLLNSIKFKE